jgi:hypothetical protein
MADLPPPGVIPLDVDALIRTCGQMAEAFRHMAEVFARAAEQVEALGTLMADVADEGDDDGD